MSLWMHNHCLQRMKRKRAAHFQVSFSEEENSPLWRALKASCYQSDSRSSHSATCESPELATCITATNHCSETDGTSRWHHLYFSICPNSHIITPYKCPTVTVHCRPVRTDWTVIGVLSAPHWLLFNEGTGDWLTSSMLLGLDGEVWMLSVESSIQILSCEELSKTLLNYSVMRRDLSVLHCGCLCLGRCGAENRTPTPSASVGPPCFRVADRARNSSPV